MAALFGQIPSNVDFTGIILPYGGETAPTGWLLCDGAAVSRTTFADLFNIIGTKYGAGDGSTTFNLPDLKGRLPVGKDGGIVDFDTLGKAGGTKTVTLAESEIPSHTHAISSSGAHQHSFNFTQSDAGSNNDPAAIDVGSDTGRYVATAQGGSSGSHSHTSNNTGGGSAHENMPPFVIVNYIIKT